MLARMPLPTVQELGRNSMWLFIMPRFNYAVHGKLNSLIMLRTFLLKRSIITESPFHAPRSECVASDVLVPYQEIIDEKGFD